MQTVVRFHWLRLSFSKAVCERRLRSVNGPTVCFQVATSFPTLEQTVKANKVESPLKTNCFCKYRSDLRAACLTFNVCFYLHGFPTRESLSFDGLSKTLIKARTLDTAGSFRNFRRPIQDANGKHRSLKVYSTNRYIVHV